MKIGKRLAGAFLVGCLAAGANSCVLYPYVPWPEVGSYALGMTYFEALAVTEDFSGGRRPPWPEWPPTAMPVEPPKGAQDMRLVFSGHCVSAIEVRYRGACEDRLLPAATRAYGPPRKTAHDQLWWTDGTREVALATVRQEKSTSCEPICMDSCLLSYRFARIGQMSGPAVGANGTAACRATSRRHQARFRIDPLHTFQRHALDEIGYLLRAD